jgi:hypothetical protein
LLGYLQVAMLSSAFHRVASCAVLALGLCACFVSDSLFDRERVWESTWFGRYEAQGSGGMFVVLPDDPARRTYLVGEFDRRAGTVDSYRVALYRGWDEVMIVGRVILGRSETMAVYTLLRPLGQNRFAVKWPQCSSEYAQAHKLSRDQDVCRFNSLDALRAALKAYDGENGQPAGDARKPLERRPDRPLSTIGIVAKAEVFDGNNAVRLLDVPPDSPAARAGLKKDDLIVGIGDSKPVVGEELLLRIAASVPGARLVITVVDARTRAKRGVTVTTVALR